MGISSSTGPAYLPDYRIRTPVLPPAPTSEYTILHPLILDHSRFRHHVTGSRSATTKRNDLQHNKYFRFPVSYVYSPQIERETEANIQPDTSELIPQASKIQTSKPLPDSCLLATRGLPCNHRPIRCVLPCTNKTTTPKIPGLSVQQCNLHLDMPTIRSRICPSSFQSTDQLGSCSTTELGCAHYCLPRRFSDSGSYKLTAPSTHSVIHKATPIPRLAGKFTEISGQSITNQNLLRPSVEHINSTRHSPRRKSKKCRPLDSSTSAAPFLVSSFSPEAPRTPELCSFHGAPRKALPSTITAGRQVSSTEQASPIKTHPSRGSVSTGLVDTTLKGWQELFITAGIGGRLNRRFRLGNRSDHRIFHPSSTQMDGPSEILAHQSPGVICGQMDHREIPRSVQKPHYLDLDRQHGCCRPNSETGGSTFLNTASRNLTAPTPCSFSPVSDEAHSSTGNIQHNRRSSLPELSTPGVAPNRGGNLSDFQEMGDPNRGPICLSPISSGPELCISESPRPTCPLRGRVLETLGMQASLGIPSTSSHTTCPSASGDSNRHLPLDNSSLGENLLASGCQDQSSRRSHQAEKSPPHLDRSVNQQGATERARPSIGSMEATGWASHIATWSAKERDLLSTAWRPSTLKTYRRPWQRWVEWALSQNIDQARPRAPDLAQFLAHLHSNLHLSPASIALHKSVIATWVDPDISVAISSHPIVIRMLRGIQTSCPKQEERKIWDIELIQQWIIKNPPSESSFFQVSRHVAILLLLASGRRVHDLTLLHITERHFQRIPPDIVFWPAFGSKTDSVTKTQSGWRLSPNQLEPLWNIVHWIDIFLVLRAQRCGSLQIPNLFISSRGRVKPASRAVIANWVKTALTHAGILASAGSFRSAVNSKLACSNTDLDNILARGNWRSAVTFIKHYYRKIESVNSVNTRNRSELVSSSFQPTN